MSVYVDRLPDCCDSCVCNDDYWRCGINNKPISHNGRREDCPLKEIVRCKDCKHNKNCDIQYHAQAGDMFFCAIADGEKQVTGKLESVEKATSEGAESTTGQQKSKLESKKDQLSPEISTNEVNTSTNTSTDLISRQAAIEAMAPFDTNHVLRDTLEGLPSVGDMGEVSDGYHTFNQLYHQRAVLFATIVNQNKDKAWKSWKHEDGKFCFDKEGEWFIVGVDTPEGSYTYHYEKKYWDMFDCEELDRGKHWDGHTEDDVTRLLSLPPVEPKKKVVAQIKVDVDEVVKRIKEEYEIKDLPVCEDAISRADTIKAMCRECTQEGYDECREDCTEVAVVKSMPPVEPKRPKGEWIENDDFTCSECGYHMIVGGGAYNFCPKCGADMRGAEE